MRSSARDGSTSTTAGGRPGSMYRLREACQSTPEPLRHRRPGVPCRRRPSTLLHPGQPGREGRGWYPLWQLEEELDPAART
eukprot:scaffold8103_cov34-Phaeocystis_antarctica.AAC.1